MVKFKKNQIALAIIVSMAILLPNICLAVRTVTYEWKDINQALIIDGGHNMKKGDLIVKLDLSSDFMETVKNTGGKLKLFIDKKGFLKASYAYFFFTVNDSKTEYKVHKKVNIKIKHLTSGLNELKFSVKHHDGRVVQTGTRTKDLVLRKLSFTEFK